MPTTTKIVDSSALAAFLFDEPEGEAVTATLRGARLAAPDWLMVELGSVCLRKLRHTPDAAERIMLAYGTRTQLGIALHAVDLDAVIALAASTRLSFYDACYLWLARQLGAPLVTLDRQLAAAAEA